MPKARCEVETHIQLPGTPPVRSPAAVDIEELGTWLPAVVDVLHHTDTALGFRVVEHMYEVEAAIA